MKRVLPWMAVLLLGLVSAAQARHAITGLTKEGTPVVIVGQITSPPKLSVGEKKFQISLGPNKSDQYTLHFHNADMFAMDGGKIAVSDLRDKDWVRAEGTLMNDPHRIKVERLEVIAKDVASVKKSKYYRTGSEEGYIERATPVRP